MGYRKFSFMLGFDRLTPVFVGIRIFLSTTSLWIVGSTFVPQCIPISFRIMASSIASSLNVLFPLVDVACFHTFFIHLSKSWASISIWSLVLLSSSSILFCSTLDLLSCSICPFLSLAHTEIIWLVQVFLNNEIC